MHSNTSNLCTQYYWSVCSGHAVCSSVKQVPHRCHVTICPISNSSSHGCQCAKYRVALGTDHPLIPSPSLFIHPLFPNEKSSYVSAEYCQIYRWAWGRAPSEIELHYRSKIWHLMPAVLVS